jgi:hypothetical protein
MALKIVTLNVNAECRNYVLNVIMLSIIILNVVMLRIIILNVIMLSIIILNVVILIVVLLNVVVPKNGLMSMNQITFTCLVKHTSLLHTPVKLPL